jgi:hypothetical protein
MTVVFSGVRVSAPTRRHQGPVVRMLLSRSRTVRRQSRRCVFVGDNDQGGRISPVVTTPAVSSNIIKRGNPAADQGEVRMVARGTRR